MAVKLRLQRHGKKGRPFFHIVAADVRAKRDGKFIEKVGTYNPNTNPATIDLSFDRALYWIKNGAVPSDTCRAILSYKGVMMRDHLDRGVLKGALTEEQADAKFQKWMEEKEGRINNKRDSIAQAKDAERQAALKAEAEVNEKRAAELQAKLAEATTEEEQVEGEEEAADTEVADVAEAPEAEATEAEEAPASEEEKAE